MRDNRGKRDTERDKIMRKEKRRNDTNGIVTANEIKRILDNYCIGKKPLAKLLGWGETTIIRYMEGDIPTAEYSNKLREIANNPPFYYDLLLKNEENLTRVAFRKSRQAVLAKLMESKLSLIAQYIISLVEGDASPLFVQAVLYYAQGFCFALYDRELFEDDYGVSQGNIPYLGLYEDMKKHGVNVLEVPVENLAKDEIELIDSVTESLSWYGPRTIKAAMASERVHYRISRDKNNNRIISKELIKRVFKELIEKYNIRSCSEIYKYMDKKMIELKAE